MDELDRLLGDMIDEAGNEDREAEYERDLWLSGEI